MIRLLILGCKDFPPFYNKKIISGGMEVYTYELVKRLAERLDISLIKGKNGKTNDKTFSKDIKVYDAAILGNSVLQPVSLTVSSFFKTLKLIKQTDVINAQTPLSALIGAFCKFFLKKPYVVCVHIFGSTKEHAGNNLFARVYFVIEKLTLNYADAVISVGDSLTKFLLDVHKLSQDKLFLIHPGMDFQEVKPDTDVLKKYGIGDEAFVLLYLGRFIKEKGIFDLVEAIKILKMRGIKVNLIFAGSGELEKEIKEESSRSGIEEYISVIGPVLGDIKNQLIKRADLMIRTSYHEVFPITYLEAMSFGTPVIATPVGDVPYLAKISGAIELVPVNDPEKIADSVARLKASPAQLQKMSESGIKFIESISWEKQADKFQRVLESVIEKRQTR
ncbi:MAG: glycosyltransferase family 4 protein [Candidatus Brocadia sinica]|nr:glycosyltransferase family 4 protein [Candidatus Brocadia sinica]NUO06666.1 glycosyltransferase family 4 protein [Candidatus Brocadia sinica]